MVAWSELDGMLFVAYCILQVGEIPSAAKARLKCDAKVVEPWRHVSMAMWSELDGTLVVRYRIFQVGKIPSTAKPRFESSAEVVEQ